MFFFRRCLNRVSDGGWVIRYDGNFDVRRCIEAPWKPVPSANRVTRARKNSTDKWIIRTSRVEMQEYLRIFPPFLVCALGWVNV